MNKRIEKIYESLPKELQTKYIENVLSMAYYGGQIDYIQEQYKKIWESNKGD